MVSLDKFDYEVKRNRDGSGSTCYYSRWTVRHCYNRPWVINITAFTDKNGSNPHGGWVTTINGDRIGIYQTPEIAAQAVVDEIAKIAQGLLGLGPADFVTNDMAKSNLEQGDQPCRTSNNG